MNNAKLSSASIKLLYRLMLGARRLRPSFKCEALGTHGYEVVRRIYFINLDRQVGRWRQMRRELASVRDAGGQRLTVLSRRFAAVDARYRVDRPDNELQHEYSLADQLFVDPQPVHDEARGSSSLRIEMSQQEAAVARSHIAVWKLIAQGSSSYTLVLEDDVYFRRSFAKAFGRTWTELQDCGGRPAFDLLYLSYEEARTGADMTPVSGEVLRPFRGLWHLSGYVLSKRGAQRLLRLLPVRGPVDLWMNHQFEKLEVFVTRRPLVAQRLDLPSSNAYSILPILSKIGLVTREKSPTIHVKGLPAPLFACGRDGTGLTSLSQALSMLGYRCCSDVKSLPAAEHQALLGNQRTRVFDAYVNVGSLSLDDLIHLARIYPQARFVVTTDDKHALGPTAMGSGDLAANDDTAVSPNGVDPYAHALLEGLRAHMPRVLLLPVDHDDKWELLSSLIGCEYPSHRYPECEDQGQRVPAGSNSKSRAILSKSVRLKWDALPWIARANDWHGLTLEQSGCSTRTQPSVHANLEQFGSLDRGFWTLRDDTFPSNLALFSPKNFAAVESGARLTLREEDAIVRDYTSASLSTAGCHQYGRFAAELKPASGAGLITGVFLHRNSPKQEIDIEFLGKDTTKLLANVYYNPGYEGATLEYGYRGTPDLIDLGFDAAKDFHRYEIEWGPTSIQWRVDGRLVCERVQWDPTPIPHLPMRFHLNLWLTRSTVLAGRLARECLPAHFDLRHVEIHT